MENSNNGTAQSTNQGQVAKKKWLGIVLCLFGGVFGIHKFYEGKIGMGLLYLVTFGFFGIGVLIDLIKLIRKPSVYYVNTYGQKWANLLDGFRNFRFDIIGKVLCGIGGVLIGLAANLEWNMTMIIIGAVLFAVGFLMTWLKTQELLSSLISSAIITVLAALAVIALFVLIAIVIVYILIRVIFGIDLFEFFSDIFGSGEKKERTEKEDQEAVFTSLSIPDQITGPYGHTYTRVSSSAYSSDFYCSENGSSVTIHDSDITASLAGMSADTPEGHFYW